MSDNGRIRPGPIRGQISARAYNRAQEAADIVLGQQFSQAAPGPSSAPPSYSEVLVKNTTTGAVNRWGVLAIGGVVFTPTGTTGAATRQFQDRPMLSGGLPTGGKAFVVAVEPIKAGGVGRCAVAGLVQAKVNVVAEADTFCRAKDGDLTQLTSAASGEGEIVWKESGTGASKWALVRFGTPAASIRLGKVSGTWSKGATASVTHWKGDGSAAVSGVSGPVTFTAINRAQTVTGPSGGYWVGVESIDGTWHLEWAECV